MGTNIVVACQRKKMRGQGIRCTLEIKEYILGDVENYVILSATLVTTTEMLATILCSILI
jgi:hypothetical protein